MVIPREARRITNSNELRLLRKSLALNQVQKDFLAGTLLGDGNLNTSYRNFRLVIRHGLNQKSYVDWKYKLLRNWTLQKPKFSPWNNSIGFRTVSHPQLTEYHQLFYCNKRKVVPKSIENLLNPFVLAVWYMDDGNIRKQNGRVYGYYLNTQSFSPAENHRLSKVLNRKFGLESYVLRNKKGYRLYFGSQAKERLPKLIGSYIVPSLQYKIR